MLRSNATAGTPATATFNVLCRPNYPKSIVDDKSEWRVLPQGPRISSLGPRVTASRWRAAEQRMREFGAETSADCHVVKIVLRSMNIRLSVAGHAVQDGIAMPGMFHVTAPAVPVRCLFRGPYDVIHLHVPNDLIAECASGMPAHQKAALCSEARLARDPAVEWLARALLGADQSSAPFGQLYVDGIGIAIVARLMASARRANSNERPNANALARWRLRRAIDYVESRLAEPVSLAEIASVTGLTRMHFAAQFRAATGLRPHEYVLRRRIERAQEMLAGTHMPVVDIALSVGFQTQSHFTSVFKRFVGRPPCAWRESHGDPSPSCGSETSRAFWKGWPAGERLKSLHINMRRNADTPATMAQKESWRDAYSQAPHSRNRISTG